MTKSILIAVRDGKLLINNRAVDTRYPVAEALVVDDLVVARLDVAIGEEFNQNVVAYSQTGETVWHIQGSPYGGEGGKVYVRIERKPDGRLIASNWDGVEYEVDFESGKVSVSDFRRF